MAKDNKSYMDIFDNINPNIRYGKSPKNDSDTDARDKTIGVENLREVMASNNIFSKNSIDRYDTINRYGFIDVYNTDTVLKEFLLFTKPDLHLLNGYSTLNPELSNDPYICDVFRRRPQILRQLQSSITNGNNPFMYLFSNQVTSKLDIPEVSSEDMRWERRSLSLLTTLMLQVTIRVPKALRI